MATPKKITPESKESKSFKKKEILLGKSKSSKKSPKFWLQNARNKMEQKGTVGAFGKATPKKITAGKSAGGLRAKRAVFAANMKAIAAKRKGK